MVVDLLDQETLPEWFPCERPQPEHLNEDRGLAELGTEGIEGAKMLIEDRGHLAFGMAATL